MKISTGSDEMNAWLDGGYDTDIITTFYGPAGSGKTNMCIMAAAQQAKQGRKIIFIDTEGGFSLDRLRQLIPQDVIKNILLLRVTNFAEQREAFNKILSLLRKNIGLIVVDSIVMLYRLEISGADEKKAKAVNRALIRQMRILNEIARKKKIPVLVTNQVYGQFLSREDFEAGKPKQVAMVGGDILKYWSKCIIELQKLEDGRKQAVLHKHRSLPEKQFLFKVNEKGIKKI